MFGLVGYTYNTLLGMTLSQGDSMHREESESGSKQIHIKWLTFLYVDEEDVRECVFVDVKILTWILTTYNF